MSSDEEWALPQALAAPGEPCPALAAPCKTVSSAQLCRLPQKRFLPADIPHPSKRTATQHALAASRMRERKASKNNDKQEFKNALDTSITILQKAGIIHPSTRLKIRCRLQAGFKNVVPLQLLKRPTDAPPEMLDVAFSPVTRRNELAKSLCIQPKKVTTLRVCCAAGLEACKSNSLDGLVEFFEQTAPCIFGASEMIDETKERMSLPIEKLHPGLARNVWNVFCVIDQYTWVFGEMGSDVSSPTYTMEMQRPPVPVINTSAEAFLEALDSLPQIKAHANFIRRGLQQSQLGLYHIDRDGHAGGAKTSAVKLRRLPSHVLGSELECCNHGNNLNENSTCEAIDNGILPWMYDSAVFLSMGGHSVRLVHALQPMVDRCMPQPLLGFPADMDKATAYANELQSLHQYHWRSYESRDTDLDSLDGQRPESARSKA